MPALNEANVRHLLRRTEIVDRPERVAALLALPNMAAAVDDVMDVAARPVPVSYTGLGDNGWKRGVRLSEHWMGQMASAARPFGERMAFFWHGHIVSSLDKSAFAGMHDQIDLFRRTGLGAPSAGGNVVRLLKTAAIQPAMLDYLDNSRNIARSPNQNFARELIELFVLGVGNYTEADVEAATAAWTGHAKARSAENTYHFRPEHHENSPQQFLGRTINAGMGSEAGNETIDVMLGSGSVGAGTVAVGPNAGRPAPRVAAEFLTFKLWQELGEASTRTVPSGVHGAMVDALLDHGFDIRPWVRALLLHDDFYTGVAKTGLVRQPAEYMVALLVACGIDAIDNVPGWLMDPTGQRLLYPPNVSGWKPNGYWVNASAMGARHSVANSMTWTLARDTWDGDEGYLQFGPNAANRISKRDVQGLWRPNQPYIPPIPTAELVDRLIDLMGLSVAPATRGRILAHLDHDDIETWMRRDAISLLLTAPEMHIA